MKGTKLSIALIAVFSIFLIIYLNQFSVAKDVKELSVEIEQEVYNQLEESNSVIAIVKLRDNFRTTDLDVITQISKENMEKFEQELSSSKGNFKVIYQYEAFNALAIELDKETLESLKNNPMVQNVYAERILQVQLQESLPLIGATNAWNVIAHPNTNLTGYGQTVCLVDTGVDYTNPYLGSTLGNKIIGGFDFVNNDQDPMDDHGHGTHMAGIISANGVVNGVTVKGVAPDAKIIAVKVCNSAGQCSSSNMIAGVNHCLTGVINYRRLSAISMSIGDSGSYNGVQTACPTWMDFAINSGWASNIPIVAPSGNQAYKNGISYPACSPNAISVGATYDANVAFGMSWFGSAGLLCNDNSTMSLRDMVPCSTNTAPNLDLVAPGAKIISTASSVGNSCGAGNSNLLFQCSGTSQAVPHVAGAIALIKQKTRGTVSSSRIEFFLKNYDRSSVIVTDTRNNLSFRRLSLNGINTFR